MLDGDLRRRRDELERIALHELFHFVWVRLGNPLRRSWEDLLRRQMRAGARGELGWSAERRRMRLQLSDAVRRTRRWREYVCESFCDTAAWRFGASRRHPEFTLEARFRPARSLWFSELSRHRGGVFPI